MFLTLTRSFIQATVLRAAADIQTYIAGKIDAIPKLIAKEVAEIVLTARQDALEPLVDRLRSEAVEAQAGLYANHPTLRVLEPLLIDSLRKRVESRPELAEKIATANGLYNMLIGLSDEEIEALEESIANFVVNQLERLR